MTSSSKLEIREHHSPGVIYGDAKGQVIPRRAHDASGINTKTGVHLAKEVQWVKCGSVLLNRADRPTVTAVSLLFVAYTVRGTIVSVKRLANWIGDSFFLVMPSVAVRFILEQLTIPAAPCLRPYDWSFTVSIAFLIFGSIYSSLKANREMVKDFPKDTPVWDVRTTLNFLDLLYYFPPAELPSWMQFLFGDPLLDFLATEEVTNDGESGSNAKEAGNNPKEKDLKKMDQPELDNGSCEQLTGIELPPPAQDGTNDVEGGVRTCAISERNDSQTTGETGVAIATDESKEVFDRLTRLATPLIKGKLPTDLDPADDIKQGEHVLASDSESEKKLLECR